LQQDNAALEMGPFLETTQSNPRMDPIHVQLWEGASNWRISYRVWNNYTPVKYTVCELSWRLLSYLLYANCILVIANEQFYYYYQCYYYNYYYYYYY